MPERMSIDWLLNENEQLDSPQDQRLPLPPGQEGRHVHGQEWRSAPASHGPVPPTTDPLLYRVNHHHQQQQHHHHHPAYPDITVRQNRASSVSSRADSISRSSQPRAPRPKYSLEEDHFIWYQRIDLEKDWKEVSHTFNEYFRDRHRDGESGLQCRFYRILDAAGIPNIRTLKSSSDKERIAQFGLIKQTRYRYSWMLPRHRAA
jgi:hypothetical protein